MKIFKFINKKKENLILLLLFIFSIYSALTIGQSYDEDFHLLQGKVTLNYLLSFGKIDQAILYRENYSSIYWAIQFFLTTIFPLKYQIEIAHLINLFFGISTIYGIGKISRKLFNKQVGKIVFLILFHRSISDVYNFFFIFIAHSVRKL